jgi:UDP-N-acetylmuramate--alanine ligase
VVDDYGHHPTEIRATLAAARQWLGGQGRIHVIFQPHRYTRTYLLMDEFVSAFPDADRLLVLDIYAASEQPIAGVNGLSLAQKIRCRNGHPAEFAASFAAAVDAVVEQVEPGDVVLSLGAGTVSQLGPQILEKLKARERCAGA